MDAFELLDKLEALDMNAVLDTAFASEAFLTVVVQSQRSQMLHGLNSEGKRIGRYRNEPYAITKYQMNNLAGFGFIDLKLTGSFHAGIFAQSDNGEMEIASMDEKSEMLESRYGENGDIFGLADEMKGDAVEVLQQELTKGVKYETGL